MRDTATTGEDKAKQEKRDARVVDETHKLSRLHVLEVASMELQAHRIARDLECAVC